MNIHDATEIAYKNGYRRGVADTVREMQKRLKANAYTESTITGYRYSVVDVSEIDQIAKEMLEGEK